MAHAQDNSQIPTTGEVEATASSRRQDFSRSQIPTDISSGKEKKLQKYSKSFEDRKKDADDFIKNNSFRDEKIFFETTAYKDGYKMFTKDYCLGIVGAPCTGKSTLIAQILYKFNQVNDYTFVLISESKHLGKLQRELTKFENCILIVDSMFAIHKYTHEMGESWLRKFEPVIKLVESRNLGIVFTMNSLVYNACKATFGNKPFFKNIIRLYDETYKMTADFKRHILANHKSVPKGGSDTNFIEEASTLSSNFGFLFWSKSLKPSEFKVTFKQQFDSIEKYAKETLSFYQKESEVLFLILFMGGQLDITLHDSENKRRFEQSTKVFPGIRDIDLKSCCEIFEGTFLKSEEKCPNKFSFVEPVVEYVTREMAIPKYGKIAFEWCSLDVIMGLINIGLTNKLLAKENLQSIAKCIRKNINSETHKTGDVVLRYECLRNGPFLKHILPEFTNQESRDIAKRLINKICEDGDIECLQYALKYLQPDDDPIDDKGRSPYQVTIYSNNNDDETVNKKLEKLILNKLNYRNVDPQASNVFHLLAEKRGLKCLEFMLQFADLKWLIKEDLDINGRTPLHTACIEQNYEAVKFFLNNCGDKKAFVNKCDNKKRSALHYAVEYLDVEEQEQHRIIKLLLESGAMTDIQDDCGKIAIHEILYCRQGVSKLINLLLGSNKSHINTQDKCGRTPLHLATKAGNVDAVRALLLEGADVTIKDDEDEMTALMFACQDGVGNSTAILELLLKAKSDFKLVNRFGLTALQEAAVEGSISCVEVLLKWGADPNQVSQNEHEETAVHMISNLSNPEAFELFKLLLDHGADISICDSDNKTVFDRVSHDLSMQIDNYLKKK